MPRSAQEAGFDALAPAYDFLKRLFFGRLLDRAAIHYFDRIEAGSTVLIVGGGTGSILPHLVALNPGRIIYLELSSRMISKAQNQALNNVLIDWLHCSWEDLPAEINADVVITPFFMDCIPDRDQTKLIQRLKAALTQEGIWLFSDFDTTSRKSRWANWRVRMLYRCFNALCKIGINELPNFDAHFSAAGFQVTASFHQGMVTSRVLKLAAK